MAEYPLTEGQKELIRSIVPGLKNGTVKTSWIVMLHHNGNLIAGLDNEGELVRSHWKHATEADFAQFVKCRFFEVSGYQNGRPSNYTLDQYTIEKAAENNFQ